MHPIVSEVIARQHMASLAAEAGTDRPVARPGPARLRRMQQAVATWMVGTGRRLGAVESECPQVRAESSVVGCC